MCNTNADAPGSRSALQIKPQEEPEPVEAQPRTDMAFVLSAPAATLAPDQLTLTGVSSTAQFITDDKKSGVVRTGAHGPAAGWARVLHGGSSRIELALKGAR